jgi:serine/threonine protein kinase
MALPVAGPEPGIPRPDGTRPSEPTGEPALAPVETVERSGQLVLRRSLSRVTWLATTDGEPVIARSLTEPRALSARTMTVLTRLRSPHLVPLLGTADLDGTTWLLSERVEGVSLQRLLTLATLTPAQAGHLGAQLLRGIAALHEEGLAHGRLHAGNVLVSRGGDPLLTDWALSSITPTRPAEELRRADLDAAGAFLVSLARNARRPVVRNDPGQQALLTYMEQLGAASALADPAAAASELDSAVLGAVPDDVGTALVCSELAALVAMVTRTAEAGGSPAKEQRPQPTHRPAFVPPTLPRSAVPSAAWQPPGRRPRSRWIAATAIVLVLVAAGLIVARKPVSSLTDRLLHRHPSAAATTLPKPSTHPKATTKPKPAPQVATPGPVPVLAPASAGFVTGVVLRPLATCRPHSGCPLTVTIRLSPSVEVEHMHWAFTVVNRCTGARTDVPGGSMTAQPWWTYVYATRTVRLPAARFLAVVAMTTAPVRAASRPFLVATGSRTC